MLREELYTIDEKSNFFSFIERKTLLDDLLEKFPHTKLMNGIPVNICPDYLGYKECDRCIHNCWECWNQFLEK